MSVYIAIERLRGVTNCSARAVSFKPLTLRAKGQAASFEVTADQLQ